jgi:hypothetical protein
LHDQKHSNLIVKLIQTYHCTNYDELLFYVSNNSKIKHQCRLYRYWGYSSTLNIPYESTFFLKMLNRINLNNSKPLMLQKKDIFCLNHVTKTKKINYLIQSE